MPKNENEKMIAESLSLNVIILPDETTSQIARGYGRILGEKYENYYTLYDRKFIPHATIYQAQYPKKNLSLVKEALGKLVNSAKPFEVRTGKLQAHHSYLWWNFEENNSLSELHCRTLNALNPLREGLLLPHLTPTGYTTGEKFTKEEAENVRKYGSVVVDELFQPHITLTRLKSEIGSGKLSEMLSATKNTFKVKELCLGRMGDHGTVVEITDCFQLLE